MPSSLYFITTLNHPPLSVSTPPPLPTCSRRGISTNTFAASTPNPRRSSPWPRAPLRVVAALPSNSAASAAPREEVEEGASLPPPLRPESLPNHVAIIMDGNSRWARTRGLPASVGHHAGYCAIKKIIDVSRRWGIRVLTVFAFSSENWTRPKEEVDYLMMLFESVLRQNTSDLTRDGIRISVIGDSSQLPRSLQKLIKEAVDISNNNTQLNLVVAISYSGRRDITQACKSIAQKVKNGLLQLEDITESQIAQELETNRILECPHPDLLIRTSGELRLSNFLLWQSAYTELFFTDTYWPDFDEADYVEALRSFQSRQRRFGQRVN